MKAFLLLLLVVLLPACTGGTYLVQQSDGTYDTATFSQVHAPRVKRSLSTTVCPEGTREVGETSGYVAHEATLDTDRGRRGGYYDSYGGYYEPSVRIQEGVGGRKVFSCVPDEVELEEGENK